MTWRELDAEQFNRLKNPLILDVRSPCEHQAECIPASINIPLLSDSQRAQVGTIYKQQGEATARILALKMIAPQIPEIIDSIIALKNHEQNIVVHCWRGGLRSETVASLLSVIGIDCFRLSGGYKSWRKQVLSDFETDRYKFDPIVLHGLTGAGKTEILQTLESRGKNVLNLEALANHRGSIFGGIGMGTQPSQKNFEAAIWSKLRSFGDGPVFLEAESRKIGKLALPDCIVKRINNGQKILVTGSIESRAKRIISDYTAIFVQSTSEKCAALWQESHLLESQVLKETLGNSRVAELKNLVLDGQLTAAVTILLVEYYDPLYMRHIKRLHPFALEVSSDNISQTVDSILTWQKSAISPNFCSSQNNHANS